jgi:hypothetical protein
MALYSTRWYSTHNTQLIRGYLTMIICFAMSYAPLSYIIMFSLALSTSIDLVCFRACSSLTPGHHHGGGAGGARVVILCTSVVLCAWGIYGIWLHPTIYRGRWLVVTVLSVLRSPPYSDVVWESNVLFQVASSRLVLGSLPSCWMLNAISNHVLYNPC